MAKKVGNTYYFTGKGKSSGGGGGGGDATDAIKYTEQTLTSPQQMQARKNQGLYYSEGGGEDVTLTWNGDTTGLETIGGQLYKVSEDAPPASEVKSVSMIQNGTEQTYEVGVSPAQIVEIEGGYAIGSLACLVITADEVTMQGATYTKGIWFVYGNENNRTSQLVYGQTETIHHIEPKYIKDMYYEEEGVKTINYDINGDREGSYTKVSDEVIEASAVIGHKFTSYNSDDGEVEYTITEDMVIAADGTQPTGILYPSEPNWAILIFPEDMEFESDSFSKGVWFRDTGTFVNPNHIESLEYDGVTVHQIPAKYIPSTQTVPAVKIEIPSMGDDVYYNMGMLNVNQYVPSRDVKFSVEGRTVQYVFVADVINGGGNSQEGDTYTFTSGGLYWVQLELNYEYGLLPYVCAMVYVESDNQ